MTVVYKKIDSIHKEATDTRYLQKFVKKTYPLLLHSLGGVLEDCWTRPMLWI